MTYRADFNQVPARLVPVEEFKVICAWCTKVIKDSSSEKISHGICPECLDKERNKYKENK